MNEYKPKNNIARIEDFLLLFSKESQEIRNTLVNVFPSYNTLLNIHAKDFEELALIQVARQQGVDYTSPVFSFRKIIPPCPRCRSTKVYRIKYNTYRCNECKEKFTATRKSIVSGVNTTSLVWMQVLHCMLSFCSIRKTCEVCGISVQTYYNIRSRLFYGMQLMLKEVRLYGRIQCDNTFIRTNFKGSSLEDDEYPEDSPIYKVNFIPRTARNRGGSYSHKENITNSVCIFTAIDNHGHSIVRYVGLGNATATKLLRAAPSEKYLKSVPIQDPFDFTYRVADSDDIGENSILISDKEKAINKYSSYIELDCHQQVYRKDGVQLRLSNEKYNIQRINALHRRLKEFFQRTNYISSKYLPGVLVLFEFIENTGATTEAIGRLFEILTMPNLGQTQDFYNNLFVTPNYLIEWQKDGSLLKNVPYNQALAAYMYHQKKIDPTSNIKMDDIVEQTGYMTQSTIRRIYKNMLAANVIDDICAAMESKIKAKPKTKGIPIEEYTSGPLKIYLELYDSLVRHLSLPLEEQLSYPEIRQQTMKDLHITDSAQKAEKHLKQIDEMVRSNRLSNKKKSVAKERTQNNQKIRLNKGIELYQRMLSSRAEYRRDNIKPPTSLEFCRIFAKEEGMAVKTIEGMISKARQYLIKEKLCEKERLKE